MRSRITDALNRAAVCANNLTEPMTPEAQRQETDRLWAALNDLRTLTLGPHDGEYPIPAFPELQEATTP